ncbi:MAG: hypothetical protein CMI23_06550 [Opitutae bacterium]|nr:hypothetical protein [Opitutae bacterium]|tara:strand:- start:1959 stop:2567 length:609 start_codon:yes stop_codon:yes gene_type:complete
MKLILSLFVLASVCTHLVNAKSRLGEYYFGFGYAMADGGKGVNLEGDFLNLSANSLASDSTDFNLNFSYGNVDYNNSDESSWELGLDYIYHYDEYIFQNGMFRPFAGLGISYLSDSAKVRMNQDGFTWKFLGGTEILFTEYFSMSVGGSFKGLWSSFGENDFLFDLGLTWWINDIHGVSIEYNRGFDQEVNFIGLKYLYSWQ